MSDKLCMCGSGQPRESLFDARGIFCCYVCDICKVSKASRYRIEVLEDPDYDCEEEICDDIDEERDDNELTDDEIEQAHIDYLADLEENP